MPSHRSLAGWLIAASVVCAPRPASLQQPSSAPPVLLPPRGNLLPVPAPRLNELEPAVAAQIREAQQAAAEVVAKNRGARDLAEAYGALARVYHAYELFESAEAGYANATRLSPGDGRWHHLLGYLYQQTGRMESAAESFVTARRVQPGDRAVTVRLGDVYLALNRLRDAREEFESVVDVFPALARQGLGEVALRDGRFAEAIDHFRAALERAPQSAAIHYSLAMAYRGLGRLDEARSHLQQRGSGSIRVGDPIVDSLQTLVRGERGLVIQGRRAYEAGQFQNAADAFSKAVATAPNSVIARVNLGLSFVQLGNADRAKEQFEAALALEPDNFTAHASLGMLLARQGRDQEALSHLRAAFSEAPDEANVSALVGALLRLGRADEAIEVLITSRSYRPDDEGTLVSLSILLVDRGRLREAIALLVEANRQFPERIATSTTLARLLASSPDSTLRDGPRALEIATRVYASEPTPAHGETVALALAELGRCNEAMDWLKRAVTDAERAKDRAEVARLQGEQQRYEVGSCKPPAR